MPLAVNHRHGVSLAVKGPGVAIGELGAVDPGKPLDDLWDVHFGVNSDNFDGEIDYADDAQADLEGLGARILDIINRGGRTAEDTWFIVTRGMTRERGATPGFEAYYDKFNRSKKVTKQKFPPGAKRGGVDVGGQRKYKSDVKNKGEKDKYVGGMQYGVRWSKTALEHACSSGRGKIHFHLDGMGDISVIVDRSGDYAYNVTSRELRYVHRNWDRFRQRIIFYNGYDAAENAVMVEPPWLWRPDESALACSNCGTAFTFFTRRHHCRRCGKIFCDDCSSQEKIVTHPVRAPGGKLETGALRVCDACFLLP